MKKILGLLGIILFVWASMLSGLGLIFSFIVSLSLPLKGWWGSFLTGAFQVGLSASLVFLWLWIWKKLEYAYFWKTLERTKAG